MKGINVLTVSSEVAPYVCDTEISEKSIKIPKIINDLGGQNRIFMPRFGVINERRHQLHEVIRLSGVNLVIDDTDMLLVIKVASIPKERIQVYFIDNEDYFKRKAVLTNNEGVFFEDNDERAMFFAKGVLQTIKKLNWNSDIIHVHGWFASLVPIYLKKQYIKDTLFKNTKIVISIYENHFDDNLNKRFFDKMLQEGFKQKDVKVLKEPTYESLMKLAIDHSDGIIMNSNVKQEIQDYVNNSSIKKIIIDENTSDKSIVDFIQQEVHLA